MRDWVALVGQDVFVNSSLLGGIDNNSESQLVFRYTQDVLTSTLTAKGIARLINSITPDGDSIGVCPLFVTVDTLSNIPGLYEGVRASIGLTDVWVFGKVDPVPANDVDSVTRLVAASLWQCWALLIYFESPFCAIFFNGSGHVIFYSNDAAWLDRIAAECDFLLAGSKDGEDSDGGN